MFFDLSLTLGPHHYGLRHVHFVQIHRTFPGSNRRVGKDAKRLTGEYREIAHTCFTPGHGTRRQEPFGLPYLVVLVCGLRSRSSSETNQEDGMGVCIALQFVFTDTIHCGREVHMHLQCSLRCLGCRFFPTQHPPHTISYACVRSFYRAHQTPSNRDDTHTGYHGQLAEDAGDMAVPGAHLLFGRHNASDARGGKVLVDNFCRTSSMRLSIFYRDIFVSSCDLTGI